MEVFWPKILRCIWYLVTSEYPGYALATCFLGAEVWVDIARGGVISWSITDSSDQTGLFGSESTKRKKRLRKGYIGRTADCLLAAFLDGIIEQVDKLVTWAIGSEPMDKERTTWKKAPFKYQRQSDAIGRPGKAPANARWERCSGTELWQSFVYRPQRVALMPPDLIRIQSSCTWITVRCDALHIQLTTLCRLHRK
jgi:hypothetical protein